MLKPLILGLGLSGKSAFRLLLSQNIVPFTYDDHYKTPVDFSKVSYLIVSPGFVDTHPLILLAKKQNKKIFSEIEFALSFLQDRFLIGITGSNGKSTMVKQIEHLLTYFNFSAKAFGNIEIPLCQAVRSDAKILVIELSAQQLEMTNLKCLDLAVILNIHQNHLDRYKTIENYTRAKLHIFDLLKPQGERLGPHVLNEVVLQKVADIFGLSHQDVSLAMESFRGLPHRIEYLGDIFGKKIYNDSKSTTLTSSLYAIQKMQGNVQVIMGGRSKGEALDLFVNQLDKKKVLRILAIGEMRHQLKELLSEHIEVIDCETVQNAVDIALKLDGDLLLSPGFASYDQFHSYAHRGDIFKQRIEWEKKMLS